MQAQGIKDIYYLTREELGLHPDAWVDYVHPSDWGMETQANAVERKVREILRIPKGDLSTTMPVTQRREPNNYEWQKRHRDILSLNQSNPPRRVILGNSITHFWEESPKDRPCEVWKHGRKSCVRLDSTISDMVSTVSRTYFGESIMVNWMDTRLR